MVMKSISFNFAVSPSGVPQAQANGYNDITSVTASHYLDGVPFVLSSQCSLGNEQVRSNVYYSHRRRVISLRLARPLILAYFCN